MNAHAMIVPSAAAPATETGMAISLGAIIARLEEAVDTETAAIRVDVNFDIKASNTRKSRYLYELNRAVKGVEPGALDATHRDGLERLRAKLEANEAAILAHLNAVKEIADLLQGTIQRAEADGTYSAGQFGRY